MGVYTQIYESTRVVAINRERQRSRRTLGDGEEAHHETPFAYACPECGEGSSVATTCLRCDVELRSSADTVDIPRRSDARDQTRGSILGAAFVLATIFAAPALLWIMASSLDGRTFGFTFTTQVALAIAVGGPLLLLSPIVAFDRFVRFRNWRRRRSTWGEAWARAKNVEASTPTTAPETPSALVRVVGSVRVEDGKLLITDGSSDVEVPITSGVRVFAGDVVQNALSTGEEVEVVGVGARKLGAGDSYRDTHSGFVFDAAHPIDVFVG